MAILLDASAILAAADTADLNHAAARAWFARVDEPLLVGRADARRGRPRPPARARPGRLAGPGRVRARRGRVRVVAPTDGDLERAAVLLRAAAEHRPRLADALLVAAAERLGVRRVATFDRRPARGAGPARAARRAPPRPGAVAAAATPWARPAYHGRVPARRPAGRAPDPLFAPPAELTPLAARMRPAALDEVVGQAHLLGPGAPLRRLVEGGRLPSMLLWGPPGSGKTTIGRLLAEAVGARFEALNTTMDGVAALRDVVAEARNEAAFRGATTVVLLDEVHRYSKAQQDALLPHVEAGTIVLVGATTEPPFGGGITRPLLSRLRVFRLEPLGEPELREIAGRALADAERGLGCAGDPRRGRPPPAHRLCVGRRAAPAGDPRGRRRDGGRGRPHRDRARRRRAGGPVGDARLRPLRRRQRLHQEHPGERPRRRPLLAGDRPGGRARIPATWRGGSW